MNTAIVGRQRERKDAPHLSSSHERTNSKSRDDKASRSSPNRSSETIHRDARRDGIDRSRDRDRRRTPPRVGGGNGDINRSLPYERDPREMSPYSRGADSRRDRDTRRESPRDRDRRGSSRDRDRSKFGSDRSREGDTRGGRYDRDDKVRYGDHMDVGDFRRDPSLKRPERPPAPAPIPPASLPAAKSPYDAAVISMDPSLVPFAEMVEQRLQQACPMVTHIIVLKEEAHVAPCVDDLTRKGVLYAVILNRVNEQHQSCTLRMLFGTPQEHRNMPLHAAMDLVAHHFDNYLSTMRDKKSEEPGKDFSRAPPGFLPPSDRIIYLLNLLADCRMLTVNELEELAEFMKIRKEKLIEVEGGPPTKRAHLESGVEATVPLQNQTGHIFPSPIKTNSLSGVSAPTSAVGPPARDEKAILAHQAELQAKILNILNPGSSSLPNAAAMDDSRNPSRNSASDSTQIQKALDTLMSTGALKDPSAMIPSNSPQKMLVRAPNAPSEARPQGQNQGYGGVRPPMGGYENSEPYYGGHSDNSEMYHSNRPRPADSSDIPRRHDAYEGVSRPQGHEGYHPRAAAPEGFGPRPGGPRLRGPPEGYQGPRPSGPEGFHNQRPQGPEAHQAPPRPVGPRFKPSENFPGGPGGYQGNSDNFQPGPRHPNPRASAPEGYQGGPRPSGDYGNYGQAGYSQGYGAQGNYQGGAFQQGGHYSGYGDGGGGQYGGRGAPPRMRMPGPPGQPGGPMQNRPRF